MNNDANKNNFLYVIIMQMTAVGISVLLNTYSTTLFLSTFSSDWLPYYFIISACVSAIGVSFLVPFLTKPVKEPALVTQSVCIAFIIIFLIASSIWLAKSFALIFTFIFIIIATIFTAIAWNIAGAAFEIRVFKEHANQFLMSSSLGAIAISFISYIGIDLFGENIILYLAIMCMAVNCFVLTKIELFSFVEKKTKFKVLLRKHNLFLTLATFLFFINIAYVFAKYQMMFTLSEAFISTEIAKFMTLFYLVVNTVTLLFQWLSKPVLEKFGLTSLFIITTIFVAVLMVPGIFVSNVYISALFYAAIMTTYSSFVSLGRQVSLNVLPVSIKNKGQLIIKAVTNNVANASASILVLIFAHYYGLIPYHIMSGAIIFVLFYLALKLKRYYGETLSKRIKEKRFYLPMLDEAFDYKFLYKEMINLLGSKDPEKIKLALSMLRLVRPEKAPKELFNLFESSDTFVRIKAYKALEHYKKLYKDDLLEAQLLREKDPEAIWYLLRLILKKYPQAILEKHEEYLQSSIPEYQSIAIIALAKYGELEQVSKAINELDRMVNSKDDMQRLFAAKVLGMIFIGNPVNSLNKLILDKNLEVSRYAIRAGAELRDKRIAKLLIEQLGERNVSFEAARALKEFKLDIAPFVYKKCLRMSIHNFKPLIRLICELQTTSIEKYLEKLIDFLPLLYSVELAKQIALRASKYPLSKNFFQKIYSHIDIVINEYQSYSKLISEEMSENKKYEFLLRKQLVEKKLICYLAAIVKPKIIMEILPKLALRFEDPSARYSHALALEYLDWLIEDRELAKKVFFAIERKAPSQVDISIAKQDSWVLQVLQYQPKEGGIMDTIDKIFALRKTQIFYRLPAELLISVAEECQVVEYSEGEKVYGVGDRPECLHILLSGRVEILSNNVLIRSLGENDFYGLFTTFGDQASTIDVFVRANSTQLVLSKQVLEQLTDDYPDILREITRFMANLFLTVVDEINFPNKS